MKILVVEDHPTQLKLAHHVLLADGHHVTAAEAAGQALDAIKLDCPEVILLDLFLPGMDGLALVRQLKADPSTRDIPVVAITSCPEKFPKRAALEAGCDAYILKPIDTRELSRQLAAVVGSGNGLPSGQSRTP